MQNASLSPFITISQDSWMKQDEVFEKELSEAAKRGFFYLEMPEDCKQLVMEVKAFAYWWFAGGSKSCNYHNGGEHIQREQAYFLQGTME